MQAQLGFREEEVISSPWGKLLKDHIPQKALYQVCIYFKRWPSDLIVTKKRWSKYGDFRPAFGKNNPRITINGDLNEFAFLITLIHEIAHHTCWIQNTDRVKPHGLEWKNDFKKLMDPFISQNIFPPDVLAALRKYMQNPAASSCTDRNLVKALKQHDRNSRLILLEDLPEEAAFVLGKGKRFRKGPKKRKYYYCLNLDNNHTYLVDPLAEVYPLKESTNK